MDAPAAPALHAVVHLTTRPDFHHILAPLDLGETTADTLATALTLARQLEADLTLLYVFDIHPFFYGPGLYVPADDLRASATTCLDETLEKARAVHPRVNAVFTDGISWPEILKVAKQSGADLIVMGTHGRRGLPRLLLGSVAEKVIRGSPIPVLTVHPRQTHEG